MSKLIADKELRENIKAMVFRVYGGDHPQGWDKTIDNLIGYVERERTAAQHQLLTEILEQLPEKKKMLEQDINYTPEDDEEYPASNNDFKTMRTLGFVSGFNEALDQVVSIIEHYLTKAEKGKS